MSDPQSPEAIRRRPRLIAEIRQRREEERAAGVAAGWMAERVDALLAEIDEVRAEIESIKGLRLDENIELQKAVLETSDRERQIALLQDQVNRLAAEKYEAKAKVSDLAITVGELRAASTGRALTATETEPELGQPDEPVSEEAALVPGASQQWFDDERAGRIRRGGEIVG